MVQRSVSRRSESFRARKATEQKSQTLKIAELFFSNNFNTNKVNFHVKFNAYTQLPFLLRYRSLKMALRAQ